MEKHNVRILVCTHKEGPVRDDDIYMPVQVGKSASTIDLGCQGDDVGDNISGKNKGEFYQFNLSSCIRQQNSLTAQFVSFSLSNLANIFYPPNFYNN